MSAEGENTWQNLTGIWHGRYLYPSELAPPVSFVATLIETATRLTGVVSEPSLWQAGAVAPATLIGHREGGAVSFVKAYDDVIGYPNPIDYTGTLTDDATEIAGIWRIRSFPPGTFLMIRPSREAESVSRKAEERV